MSQPSTTADPPRTDGFLIEYAFLPRFPYPRDASDLPAWQEMVRSQVSDDEYLVSKRIYEELTVPLSWPVPPRHVYRVLAAFRRKAHKDARVAGFTAELVQFHGYVGQIILELRAAEYDYLKDEETVRELEMESLGFPSRIRAGEEGNVVADDESEGEDTIHERFGCYDWDDYGKPVYCSLMDRLGLRDDEDTDGSDMDSNMNRNMDTDMESDVEGNIESDMENDAPAAKRRRIEGDCSICFSPLKADRTPEQVDFCVLMWETCWLGRENADSNENEQSQEGHDEDEDHGKEPSQVAEGEDEGDNDNDGYDDNDDGLVWCRASCGINYHFDCFRRWVPQFEFRRHVTYPSCRRRWSD
ncbi:hypothetical protein ASPCAL01326 [Aspergillus calidoustus]|uniref:RING-type domain-containing protein n=1 Tax=Aspergillus calidoustus TaxID=454130 RepID=A0A0U5FR38_ASPCI|nr:hypothetical protein ASPCAL01326 [Aspergillus calidoustus]